MNYGVNLLGAMILISATACDRTTGFDRNETERSQAELDESGPTNTVQPAVPEVKTKDNRYQNGLIDDDDDEREEALELVIEASQTLERMRKDTRLEGLLRDSKGVLLVPRYARGAAVVGARGGEGLLLTHRDGEWSGPYFFDIGGVSVGAQAGAEAGELAVILLSDEAIGTFEKGNGIALSADAKLTLVDYSRSAQAAINDNETDAVFWSDVEGVFAGVSLGVTDVNWDDEENKAYYGQQVSISDALKGSASSPQSRLERQLKNL